MKKKLVRDHIVQFRAGGIWLNSCNSGADRRYTQLSAKRRAKQQMHESPGMTYRVKKVSVKK
jgi:hypothetical protein